MADRFQMVRPHARGLPAQMIQFQTFGDRSAHLLVSETMGSHGAPIDVEEPVTAGTPTPAPEPAVTGAIYPSPKVRGALGYSLPVGAQAGAVLTETGRGALELLSAPGAASGQAHDMAALVLGFTGTTTEPTKTTRNVAWAGRERSITLLALTASGHTTKYYLNWRQSAIAYRGALAALGKQLETVKGQTGDMAAQLGAALQERDAARATLGQIRALVAA